LLIGCWEDSNSSSEKISKPTTNKIVDNSKYDFNEMITNWSTNFVEKIDTNYKAIVNFKLSDSGKESYYVEFKRNNFKLNKGISNSSNFTFESSLEHYNKMYKGEMTALTSMGQATSNDSIPLIPNLEKPIGDNLLNDFLFFSQRYFNLSRYDKVSLSINNSRLIHGGHAIPIFYKRSDEFGVRSAWYQINKGEQVNDIGDTNPFPQYFVITSGKGFAKIGKDTISISSNEAYFVAPENEHIFWNEKDEPLTLIFIAFGKGA
jgi:Mannose-6-phosphate isomerase